MRSFSATVKFSNEKAFDIECATEATEMSYNPSMSKSASEEGMNRFVANVDVWQAIFEMLPVKDRIRLEITNKRLRILMFACWKRVTSFSTECVTEMNRDPKKLWTAFAAICVDRIGNGLRSLTIQGEFRTYESRTLDIRFDSFSRLKTLTVCTSREDFTRASASVFLSIPASIEVICGLTGTRKEPFQNAAQMEGFFADRPSLRDVCLGLLRTHDGSKANIFGVIAERCRHLKSIKLPYNYYNCIDYHGVVALESMKELRMPDAVFNEMEIVTICGRSPLVEALEFSLRSSSHLDLQWAALNALGALTKLGELRLKTVSSRVVAPLLVTEFLRELAQNSGASLRLLEIDDYMPLPTAAIEALANGCGKLRLVTFSVFRGEATPASVRLMIDSVVDNPDWVSPTGEPALQVRIHFLYGPAYAHSADRAAFEALAAPAANLPAGVNLIIW